MSPEKQKQRLFDSLRLLPGNHLICVMGSSRKYALAYHTWKARRLMYGSPGEGMEWTGFCGTFGCLTRTHIRICPRGTGWIRTLEGLKRIGMTPDEMRKGIAEMEKG